MSSPVHPINAGNQNVAFPGTQETSCELSAHYDYVMVFKLETGENGQRRQTAAAKDCMKAMIAAGLEIFPYPSVQEDEIYVLIRAPVRWALRLSLVPVLTHAYPILFFFTLFS